jgi:hypothetical protein
MSLFEDCLEIIMNRYECNSSLSFSSSVAPIVEEG